MCWSDQTWNPPVVHTLEVCSVVGAIAQEPLGLILVRLFVLKSFVEEGVLKNSIKPDFEAVCTGAIGESSFSSSPLRDSLRLLWPRVFITPGLQPVCTA
jgi:hypothetical protein